MKPNLSLSFTLYFCVSLSFSLCVSCLLSRSLSLPLSVSVSLPLLLFPHPYVEKVPASALVCRHQNFILSGTPISAVSGGHRIICFSGNTCPVIVTLTRCLPL